MKEKMNFEEGLLHKEIDQEAQQENDNLDFAEEIEQDVGDLFVLLHHLPSGSNPTQKEWDFDIRKVFDWIFTIPVVSLSLEK